MYIHTHAYRCYPYIDSIILKWVLEKCWWGWIDWIDMAQDRDR